VWKKSRTSALPLRYAFEQIGNRAIENLAKNVQRLELDAARLVVIEIVNRRVREAGLRLKIRLRHAPLSQQLAQSESHYHGGLCN